MTPAEVAQWWRRGWQDAVRGFLAPDGKLSPIRQAAWEDGHARGKEAVEQAEAESHGYAMGVDHE